MSAIAKVGGANVAGLARHIRPETGQKRLVFPAQQMFHGRTLERLAEELEGRLSLPAPLPSHPSD